MATIIGTGFCEDPDHVLAFRTAAVLAKSQTNLVSSDLAIVISTPKWPATPQALEAIQKVLQPNHLLYVCAPGIIMTTAIHMRGVGVLSLSSDEIRFNIAFQDQISLLPAQESGIGFSRDIAAGLATPKRHALCYFLSNPTHNNGSFIRGVQEGLGRAFPIFGGITGNLTTAPSAVGAQNRVSSDAAVGLLIGGQVSLSLATHYGWQPLGRPRMITEAEGSIIRKIDNKPAIKIYENYFQEEMEKAGTDRIAEIGSLYPLGIGTSVPKQYLLRSPLEVLSDGSLVCQGDVTPNMPVHLMIGEKEACRQAAHKAAIEAREGLHGKLPRLALIFNSISQHKLFGRSAWQEIALIKETLGLTTPLFGMYTYGEIAPQGVVNNIPNIQVQCTSTVIATIG